MTPLLQDVIVQLRLFEQASVHAMMVGNRKIYTFTLGETEYTLTQRNLAEPDGYERTEVFAMLRTVRACERIQRWTCPEPSEQDIQGAARSMLPPRMP